MIRGEVVLCALRNNSLTADCTKDRELCVVSKPRLALDGRHKRNRPEQLKRALLRRDLRTTVSGASHRDLARLCYVARRRYTDVVRGGNVERDRYGFIDRAECRIDSPDKCSDRRSRDRIQIGV